MRPDLHMNRRQFLKNSALVGSGLIAHQWFSQPGLAQSASPSIITSDAMRPQIPYGVASGDITTGQAVIWSRCDRPARMIVDYGLDESFKETTRIIGPAALETSDYTARINLSDLPPDSDIYYRVSFQDLSDVNVYSEPTSGFLKTAPATAREIVFAWSGDTAGQGWGINPEWGGMKIYKTIHELRPDFFVHCGDYIYADGPIEEEVELEDGTLWRNLIIPEKMKVAETLKEFRGNYVYNLMDENVLRFNAEVPLLVQWDDHETTNNWYPTEVLEGDDRYEVKSVALLAARAKQAFLEYTPIRLNGQDPERIYRSFNYGPQLDIFMLDKRSYRGANTSNRQAEQGPETEFLGQTQLEWLKQQLKASQATWKVIASDMPVGLIVRDGDAAFENMANGDGKPAGRELEMANLLRYIKRNDIKNVVWITADVHYAAAHYYDPDKAQFQDFKPFWEFVSGPLNAGTFGPNELDNTFGPQVKFQSIPSDMQPNRSPLEELQFFGVIKISGDSNVMTVEQRNITGETIFSIDLEPEEA